MLCAAFTVVAALLVFMNHFNMVGFLFFYEFTPGVLTTPTLIWLNLHLLSLFYSYVHVSRCFQCYRCDI